MILRDSVAELVIAFALLAPAVAAPAASATAPAAEEGKAGNTKHAIPNTDANNESKHWMICVPPWVLISY